MRGLRRTSVHEPHRHGSINRGEPASGRHQLVGPLCCIWQSLWDRPVSGRTEYVEARHRPSRLQSWRRLYRRDELDWVGSLILALFCVAAATGAHSLLGLIGPTSAFATFFPAVMTCALVGGRRTGLSIARSVALASAQRLDGQPPRRHVAMAKGG
jgi:hypothetical protein